MPVSILGAWSALILRGNTYDIKTKNKNCVEEKRKKMSLGVEIAMAVVGLWAVYLRPMLMRYAGELTEVMGYAIFRIMRGTPSFAFSAYLPYSSSFLHWQF
ncbi:hypothetical protein I3760_11G168300 [Carya illinoinensis]|uniref:Uncharacterized protein n=1 Tax=Carya illinoinensis TaxID=32201 RepID=A0A922DSB2_CARIL|nr:hypothetical protein I3760_11G168300 [Carya illinoinensis]KAG6689372.1 hypothetical protein I3842_11G171100 [Carya illinoinensis]